MDPTKILNKLPEAQRASAWDAIAGAKDGNGLKAVLDPLPLSPEDKAALWDMRSSPATSETARQEPQEPSWLAKTGRAVLDVGIGAAKGLASSAIGAGQLVASIPGVAPAIDAAYGAFGVPVNTRQDLTTARSLPEVTPTNTAQEIGRGVEQVGEFFALPSSKIKTASSFAGLARQMQAPRLMQLAQRGVVQGVGAGTLASMQGATPGEATATGVLSSTFPALGFMASKAATPLREFAEKKVQQGLGPTKEYFKELASKITPDILASDLLGRLGTSRKALLKTATEKAGVYGRQIDEELTKNGVNPTTPQKVIDALEKAKDEFRLWRPIPASELVGNPKLASAAREVAPGQFEVPVVFERRAVRQLSDLQTSIEDLGGNATVSEVVAVRRVWDKIVDRAGGFTHRRPGGMGVPLADQSEAEAKRVATNEIRKMLDVDAPKLSELNKHFAFWAGLRDVTEQTIKRTRPQSTGLGRVLMTAGGSAVGASQGSSYREKAMNAAMGAYAGNQLIRAFTSPRWRFIEARYGNDLAESLASGDASKLKFVASKIGAYMSSETFKTIGAPAETR